MLYNKNFRLYIFFCLGAILFLLASAIFKSEQWKKYQFYQTVEQNNEIHQSLRKEAFNVIHDTVFIKDVTSGNLNGRTKILNNNELSILIYHDDTLKFWNNSLSFNKTNDQISLNVYDSIHNQFILNNVRVDIYAYIPIVINYAVKNKYLGTYYNNQFKISNGLNIERKTNQKMSVPIIGTYNETLGYYTYDPAKFSNALFLSCFFIGLLCLLIGFNLWSKSLLPGFRLLISIVISIIIIKVSLLNSLLTEFTHFELWQAFNYASSFSPSLGHLFIILALILYNAYIFFLIPLRPPVLNQSYRILWIVVAVGGIFTLAHFLVVLTQSLIIDANNLLVLNKLFVFEKYSIAALFCLSLATLAFGFIAWHIIAALTWVRLRSGRFLYVVLTNMLLYIWINDFLGIKCAVAIWTAIFIYGLLWLTGRKSQFTLINALMFIAYFSLFYSSLIVYHSDKKEKNTLSVIAHKLALKNNPITEYLLSNMYAEIAENLNANKIGNCMDSSSLEAVKEEILSKYVGSYFDFFDIRFSTICEVSNKASGDTNIDYSAYLQEENLTNQTQNIYAVNTGLNKHNYLLAFNYADKNLLYILFKTVSYTNTNLYPELLLESSFFEKNQLSEYSYVIYDKGKFHRSKDFLSLDNLDELSAHHIEKAIAIKVGDKTILFYRNKNSWMENMAWASYIFCFMLISILIIFLAGLLLTFNLQNALPQALNKISLRDKINITMILFIILSLIGIIIFTYKNIVGEYNEYHQARLKRKAQSVITSIYYLLSNEGLSFQGKENKVLENEIKKLADIHTIDVNLYKSSGKLWASSQYDIFDKHILSENMNPLAFNVLKQNRRTNFLYVLDEKLGSLNYISAFSAITNEEGDIIAYVNLPYFAKEKDLQKEIASFLEGFINIYTLFILIGSVLILLLSNYLTKTLTVIGSKLKETKLGGKNEPLIWAAEDEIGILVKEYNKMLLELEKSALLLKTSEREGAWRDIAKQVAHEIKNPLTPMKLNIQHLKRAGKEGAENLAEMTSRVADTLVEQIDALSKIASEFSSFAKMPVAKNQEVLINDIIEHIYALFKDSEEADFKYDAPAQPFYIFADKDLLLRVFTNIVKNAIQAIPSTRHGKIKLKIYQEAEMVIISVKDNGVGIDLPEQEKVFVPNFTTKSSGTGIGLAIARNIVEQAQGKVWFVTTPGSGTTFFVAFPIIHRDEGQK